MTKGQIDEIVEAFAAAAERMARSGLDGVELHFAHGYLVQQFLSPLSNLREDDYGGTLENRARFGLEILDAVRSSVPADFPVGVRLSPEEIEGGLTGDDSAAIAKLLAETGKVDFIDASMGSYFHLEKFVGGMYEPAGYQMDSSTRIAAATELPTIATGRITTLAEAEETLAAGKCDLVGLTRAHIADPEIVAKSLAGRASEVRPCIACDMCLASMNAGRIACTVNATAGREQIFGADLPRADAAPETGRIVVVGAGPAGLEAARVARLRGHEVIVLERESEVGGQLRFARLAPNRARIGTVVDWLERELRRLEVEVRLGFDADPTVVTELAPDLVVLATGSEPKLDGVQLARPARPLRPGPGSRLISSWEALSGTPDGSTGAVVIDERGEYEAIAACESLVEKGYQVDFVTRFASFAPRVEASFEPGPALERMLPTGRLRIHTRSEVRDVESGSAYVGGIHGGPATEVENPLLVFVGPNRPRNEMAAPLREAGLEVTIVGDAFSQRNLLSAIRDGHDAARAA